MLLVNIELEPRIELSMDDITAAEMAPRPAKIKTYSC
jgi:hypothetical protein